MKKKGSFWGKFSISKKFVLSLCMILIAPLFGLFLWINQNVTKEFEEQAVITGFEVLKQTKTPIHYLIEDVGFISLDIIGNDHLQDYLKSDEPKESTQLKQLELIVQYELRNIFISRENISRLSIYAEDGMLFHFGPYLTNDSIEYKEETELLRGKPYWTPALFNDQYVWKSDNKYEVSMRRVINNDLKMDDVIGYEIISISEAYLSSLYEGIAGEETKNMLIVNQTGDVISSISKEMLGKNISSESYFDTIIKSSEGYLRDNNEIISYYNFENIDWFMIKIDDQSLMTKRGIFNSIIIASIVLTFIFGIIFYSIQRSYIIKPVIQLKKDMSRIKDGFYNIETRSVANDEIGDLNQGLIEMSLRIQELIEQEYKMKIREKESQLQYLQSQINPHFLYNTLDSIRWMALKSKQKDLALQIQALSNHFKHSLNQGKEMTTVGEEVKHLQDYLTIQKNRFGDVLNTIIKVDKDVENLPVLNLILQPLVENSIVHGLENKLGDWLIKVSVWKEADKLYYKVEDNGMGVDEELIRSKIIDSDQSNEALALRNINKRIQYKYGSAYKIDFSSRIGEGTKVIIMIPIEGGGQL